MPYPTQDRIRELLDYDPCTGVFTWRISRGNRAARSKAGTLDSNGYVYIAIDKKDYVAHKLAWIYTNGDVGNRELDHINLQKNDNRITNLRVATRAQNCANSRIRSTNKSGYKGVKLERGRWIARIKLPGQNKYLGSFKTPQDAHAAYVRAAQLVHGEFANGG